MTRLRNLLQPDGPDAGEPWHYTPEQARFILWWYAIDERGRFLYRYGMLRRMKGWGKDPVGASICCIEFVGPCRFSHFEGEGPVAVPHSAAWVQTAAVSRDQTRSTMTLFPGMLSPETIQEHGIDLGKEIIYAHSGRCRIEAVTSSPRSLEGQRSTFVLKNENHLWIESNEGHAMSAVIARNLAKSRDGSARALAISNAHSPGEDSDAERDYMTYLAIEAGETRATGFLYDSIEAPANTDLADEKSLHRGLTICRGDSDWVDIERIMEEIWDPRTEPSITRRFYLNQITAEEGSWIAPHEWEACYAKRGIKEGEQITLGLDGSKSEDHTALTGCCVSDGHVFPIGLWDPSRYRGQEVPRKVVDGTVDLMFVMYDVVGFYSDVKEWESYIDKWEEEYGDQLCVKASYRHPIGWDMRSKTRETTNAVESFNDGIIERAFTHSASRRESQQVYNAKRRPNQYGVTFSKETPDSSRKVDWLASAVLARKARQDYVALPDDKKRQTKRLGIYIPKSRNDDKGQV